MLLAEMPRMLADIVKDAVTRQADMEVIPHAATSMTLASLVAETRPDVVVVGRDLLGDDLERIRRSSGAAFLALTGDGRSAFRYRLQPEPISIDQGSNIGISPQVIVDAIRAETRRRNP